MTTFEPSGGTRPARARLTQRLIPQGVSRLWCPTLTHFVAAGEVDALRLRRHWQHLRPYVGAVLVPGSTGEGWEMSDADVQRLLTIVLDLAKATDMRVLIGVLKTDLPDMLQCLEATMAFLRRRAGASDPEEVFLQTHVVGFTVCPPRGSHLDQQTLAESVSHVLERGLPVALYQLPQVTGNELSAATVQALAARYHNFHLFKDTSGKDLVAQSQLDYQGVFLVRGAEGDYARWLRAAGGPYDGFLLSTANVFAREFDTLLRHIDEGRQEEAQALATRIGRVVEGCFDLVRSFPTGNAFTNANKVLDHLMAYGEAGVCREPPLLYSGVRLPAAFLESAATLLRQHELMPQRGYLE